MTADYDVVVVGGGITGTYLGGNLAGSGLKTAILEKNKQSGGKLSCTGLVSEECAQRFSIPETAVINKINSAKIYSPSGKVISLYRQEPQAWLLDRNIWEEYLVEEALKKGVSYITDSQVYDLNFFTDRVEVLIKGSREHCLKAKLVVLACGFYKESFFLKNYLPTEFVFGVQTMVETNVKEVEIYFNSDFANSYFAWLIPTSYGIAKAGLLCNHNPTGNLTKFLKFLQMKYTLKLKADDFNLDMIPLSVSPKTYGERLLLLGDAAGQVKPLTGGGIYFGLLSALEADKTIQKAFSAGDFSETFLKEYQDNWKKVIGRELEKGYKLRKLLDRLSASKLDLLFDYLSRPQVLDNYLQDETFKFDWLSEQALKFIKEFVFYHLFNTFSSNRD